MKKEALGGLLVLAILLYVLINVMGPGSKFGTGWKYLVSGQTSSSSDTQQSSFTRIDQTDRAQYVSQQEYNMWNQVSCSAAAIAYVLNTYGNHFTVHDVLQDETGQIDTSTGLVTGFNGVAITVNRLGYHASAVYGGIDGIVRVANGGTPVIVSMKNADWPYGHVLVVTGGDNMSINVVDSWTTNKTSISRADFAAQWTGVAATIARGV